MVLIAAALAAHAFVVKGTAVVPMPIAKGRLTAAMPTFTPDASPATPRRGTPDETWRGSPRRSGGRGS